MNVCVNERISHEVIGLSHTNLIRKKESVIADSMPKEGDIFKGKVNDLRHPPIKGWGYRDISFFKHELIGGEKFGYPMQGEKIVLIDTEGVRYELNCTKPDLVDKVCLGTPTRLKPWYQKKGFDDLTVDPGTWVYFRYTGHGNEFYIFTEEEYRSNYYE